MRLGHDSGMQGEAGMVGYPAAGVDLVFMQEYRQLYSLQELPVPFHQPPIAHRLYWASRYDKDPANQWIRNLVMTEFQALLHESGS